MTGKHKANAALVHLKTGFWIRMEVTGSRSDPREKNAAQGPVHKENPDLGSDQIKFTAIMLIIIQL